MKRNKILITGGTGFIGYHLSISLLKDGYDVLGIDIISDYYDVNLKLARLANLKSFENFSFKKADISDYNNLSDIFRIYKPEKVVNLAAQAGVRYSIQNPKANIKSNIEGFFNVIDLSKQFDVEGFIYASSSSVYGSNKNNPFSITDRIDSPISLYAATKASNELIAKSYTSLYGMRTTGLRFFTAYGPWGRPDMAMYLFTKNILEGLPIKVYNHGDMKRDFTYIDDIIAGIKSAIKNNYKCEIFNLGNNRSEELMYMIKIIEKSLNKEAKINYLPLQLGDIKESFANIDKSKKLLGFHPSTNINEGIENFINWFLKYYKVN